MIARRDAFLALVLCGCSSPWIPSFLRDPKEPIPCEDRCSSCAGGVCEEATTDSENQNRFGARCPMDSGAD